MSPLPKLAGGRPDPAAIADGTNADSTAPPPISAPAPRPTLLKNDKRVSPLTPAAASRTAPSTSMLSKLNSSVTDCSLGSRWVPPDQDDQALSPNLYARRARPDHRRASGAGARVLVRPAVTRADRRCGGRPLRRTGAARRTCPRVARRSVRRAAQRALRA